MHPKIASPVLPLVGRDPQVRTVTWSGPKVGPRRLAPSTARRGHNWLQVTTRLHAHAPGQDHAAAAGGARGTPGPGEDRVRSSARRPGRGRLRMLSRAVLRTDRHAPGGEEHPGLDRRAASWTFPGNRRSFPSTRPGGRCSGQRKRRGGLGPMNGHARDVAGMQEEVARAIGIGLSRTARTRRPFAVLTAGPPAVTLLRAPVSPRYP